MAQVKNIGGQAIPYRGGYILPGRVKTVADEDIDALRKEGEIVVLPSADKSQRPSAPTESAVAESDPIPAPPADIEEEVKEEDEGEDKPKKKRSLRKKESRK